MNEGAAIIDILHQCILLDSNRDSVATFNYFNRVATEQYQRFFDSSFQPLLHAGQIPKEFKIQDAAIGLNNRAVMARIKVLTH